PLPHSRRPRPAVHQRVRAALAAPLAVPRPARRGGSAGEAPVRIAEARGRSWAILIARWILGVIFFMAGEWKVFVLGPLEHAPPLLVAPQAHTFLPPCSLC